MIISSIEKLAKDIGWDIGHSNDVVQSDLLNGFCRALHDSMPNNRRDTQICSIVHLLDSNADCIITELYEFIKYKKEDAK